MMKYQWSTKAINTFAQLFTQLELHPYRQREFGERALIIYQARVRCEWHDQLKLGSAFNISVVSEDLLHSIYQELLDKAQLLSLNEVSVHCPVSCLCEHLLTLFSLLFPSSSMYPHILHLHHAPCTLHLVPCTIISKKSGSMGCFVTHENHCVRFELSFLVLQRM
jgi:hypothetical protein